MAKEYPQSVLVELLECSTVTAARVHAMLFGSGGVQPESLKFTCQRVSQHVLDKLADYLLNDVSRPSLRRHLEQEREPQSMSHLVPIESEPHLSSPKHSYALNLFSTQRNI